MPRYTRLPKTLRMGGTLRIGQRCSASEAARPRATDLVGSGVVQSGTRRLASAAGRPAPGQAPSSQHWRESVGPTTLPRMRGVRAEGERDHHPQHGHYMSPRPGASLSRTPQAFAALALPLLALAAPQTRHWLAETGATLCVAGGIIAAPVLTLAAWIGLALPPRMLLHQASTALFLVAIIWMAAALIGAHLHHDRRAADGKWHGAQEE